MTISEDSVKRTGFRLPTEAEWEYFCRAGTETSRPFGESPEFLSRYAWTWLNSDNQIHPPGQLLPNELGLFDVLGNAWEWCQDGPPGHYVRGETDFPPYPAGTKEDPAPDPVRTETVDFIDRANETWRILRGGAFSYSPDHARSAYRDWQPSSDTREYLGIRVVRTLPPRNRKSLQLTQSRPMTGAGRWTSTQATRPRSSSPARLPCPHLSRHSARCHIVVAPEDGDYETYLRIVQQVTGKRIITRFVRLADVRAIKAPAKPEAAGSPETWDLIGPKEIQAQDRQEGERASRRGNEIRRRLRVRMAAGGDRLCARGRARAASQRRRRDGRSQRRGGRIQRLCTTGDSPSLAGYRGRRRHPFCRRPLKVARSHAQAAPLGRALA